MLFRSDERAREGEEERERQLCGAWQPRRIPSVLMRMLILFSRSLSTPLPPSSLPTCAPSIPRARADVFISGLSSCSMDLSVSGVWGGLSVCVFVCACESEKERVCVCVYAAHQLETLPDLSENISSGSQHTHTLHPVYTHTHTHSLTSGSVYLSGGVLKVT